jgi:hypothetical protein
LTRKLSVHSSEILSRLIGAGLKTATGSEGFQSASICRRELARKSGGLVTVATKRRREKEKQKPVSHGRNLHDRIDIHAMLSRFCSVNNDQQNFSHIFSIAT